MKYINLTPRWTEILTVWKRIVDHNSRHRVNRREENNKAMNEFWKEVERMAQGADNFNDLVAYLRQIENYTDEQLERVLKQGRHLQEVECSTVKESDELKESQS